MTEIKIDDILKYKPNRNRSRGDYSRGGFYMIKHENGMCYIGKSVDYMHRLKSHIKCSPKLLIDVHLHSEIRLFKFYLINDYDYSEINFHNRHLETVYEQTLIKIYQTKHPKGYNIKTYEHLCIK